MSVSGGSVSATALPFLLAIIATPAIGSTSGGRLSSTSFVIISNSGKISLRSSRLRGDLDASTTLTDILLRSYLYILYYFSYLFSSIKGEKKEEKPEKSGFSKLFLRLRKLVPLVDNLFEVTLL